MAAEPAHERPAVSDAPTRADAGQIFLELPEPSLVALVGVSGCGKSTFARTHFAASEIVSSDACRALVSDDENDQSATSDAFELLHLIAGKRLARRRLTVVDATNVRAEARRPLLEIAARHHLPASAIVLDLPVEVCLARHAARPDRAFDLEVIRRQRAQLDRTIRQLATEGFARVHVLRTPAEVARVAIVRRPLAVDRRWDHGPFDIVGDVHGCGEELEVLLRDLGYAPDDAGVWRHPAGRRALFVGDLVDRGPRIVEVLRLVMTMVESGSALCLPGNHDDKLRRKLRGRTVQVKHGLEQSVAQLARAEEAFGARVARFIEGLPSHYVLAGGDLVVAHAGMKANLQGRDSRRVRDFALYGDTTGEVDQFGLPVRKDWAAEYRGDAHVVYGHTPVAVPTWVNRTIDIDTGCVFGWRLTALRWPERELCSVAAVSTHATTARPFLAAVPPASAP